MKGETMKNTLKALCICICFLFIFSGAVSAKQLSVKKVVLNTDIKTGDSVSIALQFENPFNKSINVTIQDNNVLGDNGLEIQCYEYTLPDNPAATLSYDLPIQAFSAGDFFLPPANITYKNPDTGEQETVKSGSLIVSIKQGTFSGLQQGITTVYNCNGVSMRSTSYSSSGSTSISISSEQIAPQTNNPNQQNALIPGDIQQENQDMQNLKQEVEQQQRNYQNMKNELGNRIENNNEFTRMREELEKQGYNLTSKDIRPSSNTSGEFNYSFNKNNETASINGKMDNGRMDTINEQSSEDIKRLQQLIESNVTFQQMQSSLIDKGYNLSDKKIDLNPNISNFDYKFNDSQGREASITGNVTRNVTNAGEIKDISLNEPKEPLPYWMLAFLILPLLGVYLYKKYWNNGRTLSVPSVVPAPQLHMNPKEEAIERLGKAIEMFNNGMQREAYVEVSNAVRAYFKGTMGFKELTSKEILGIIKDSRDETYTGCVKQCFTLCDLVKFAKYEPNLEDFNRAVEHAKKIIV